MDILLERTSIRQYTAEDVNDEDLRYILKAAMSAPTARNTRCWSFIVIKDKETHKKIAQAHKAAQMVLGAPLAILVVGDMDKVYCGYMPQDCAAATQNILLAATAKGYGSVWCGICSNEEREKAFSELFNLPENIKPFSLVVIGRPAEKPGEKTRWSQEKIKNEAWK
jgi:Nitroreductase